MSAPTTDNSNTKILISQLVTAVDLKCTLLPDKIDFVEVFDAFSHYLKIVIHSNKNIL